MAGRVRSVILPGARWAAVDSDSVAPSPLRTASYIDDYNRLRPHEALDYATPDAVYYASFRVA